MSDYSTMMEKADLYDKAVEQGLVPPDWVPKAAAPPRKAPEAAQQQHERGERERK